jgi:D-psicose/D-tagatose/L-ribulose 3-epimerase
MMRIALCNEVLRDRDFRQQCSLAAALGYDGLEIAPFTLDENPHWLSAGRRTEVRRIVEEAGLAITGLHWLLVVPEGLSVTSPETEVRRRTLEVIRALIGLCADLGGRVVVHGSPKQRMIAVGDDPSEAKRRAVELFAQAAETAREEGVTYCIEPLTPAETNYINNLSEAVALVREVGNPAFLTMLDTKAASVESASVDELCDRWLPEGIIAHVHVNDRNLRGPGQGEDRFGPLFAALHRHNYEGVVSVEPFDYHPDGATAAARAVGYIQGLREGLDRKPG